MNSNFFVADMYASGFLSKGGALIINILANVLFIYLLINKETKDSEILFLSFILGPLITVILIIFGLCLYCSKPKKKDVLLLDEII